MQPKEEEEEEEEEEERKYKKARPKIADTTPVERPQRPYPPIVKPPRGDNASRKSKRSK